MRYTCFKKIDDVGRIVIPKELREALDIHLNDSLMLDIENDRIVISKADRTCIFCGNTEGIRDYLGKTVCENCISNLNRT